MEATILQPQQQPPPSNSNSWINNDEEEHQRLVKAGYVFSPSDELLLTKFLKNKIEDPTYAHPAITEINNLYDYNPLELLDGKIDDKGVYFYAWRNRDERNQPNRNAKDGYWEITEENRVIKHPSLDDVKIGLERTFVFFTGQSPTRTRSEYVMSEYQQFDEEENNTKMDVWVICQVFKSTEGNSMEVEKMS